MHDDACPTYSAMIDQTTMGHQFINDLFGADALPITGWTVDPFGLSPITAKVFFYSIRLTILDQQSM
jgi:hypothetical protein